MILSRLSFSLFSFFKKKEVSQKFARQTGGLRVYQISWRKRVFTAFLFSLFAHVLLFSPFYLKYFFDKPQQKPSLFAVNFKIIPLGNRLEVSQSSSRQKEKKKISDYALQKTSEEEKKIKGSSEGEVQADVVFLQENYEQIAATVHNALIYPVLARSRLWQGEAVVAFTITADGKVEDVQIEKSSGYEVLDVSAVKTVQSMKGFPWPPFSVRLKIPIEYKLK